MANNLSSSILYDVDNGVNRTSTASEFNFYYDGDFVLAKASNNNSSNACGVYCDGVFLGQYTSDGSGYIYIYLPSGLNKYVRIVQNAVNHYTFTNSVYLTDVFVQTSKFTRDNPTTVSKTIFALTDSIGQGYNSSPIYENGYLQKIRYEESENVIIGGWSGAYLGQMVINEAAIVKTLGYISEAFSKTTTEKVLLLNLGTNDFGLHSTSASIIGGYMDTLLDRVNTMDSTIECVVISPFYRDNQTSLLTDYGTQYSNSCSTRSWATYYDANSVIGSSDLDDGLHPTNTGAGKIKTWLYPKL